MPTVYGLKRKLLITGAGGFLGRELCRQAAAEWQVFATWHHTPIGMTGVVPVPVELTDPRGVRRILDEIRPDGVIHTAAVTDPNFCQEHPHRSHRVNVTASANLAGYCAERSIPLAFTSSDLVFDGTRAPYREKDPVSPICVYGTQKAAAEALILDCHPHAAVCRLPLMIGRPGPTGGGFEDQIARRLKSGRAVTLFVDEFRTPVDTGSAAGGLLLAFGRVSGRIHLGGRRRVSRYQLGAMIAEVIGADRSLLVPSPQSRASPPAPRPADVSLDSSRAYRLGYDPVPIEAALRGIFKADR